MTIAITAALGNIGSVITKRLLDAGADVTILVRSADRAKAFADRGATVRVGDLNDESFVIDATRGAKALFWLTPPNMAAPDFRAYQNRLGDIAAAAIRANAIPHVVNLSSFGAHLTKGTGPIVGLHDVEKKLDAVATNIVHLRPGFFMENLFNNLETIKGMNSIFAPIAPDAHFPIIATRDIGEAAADLLLNRNWTGITHRELHGAAHRSFGEIAGAIGNVIGQDVKFIPVSAEQALQAMTGAGLPKSIAELYVELYQGLGNGSVVAAEPFGPQTATPTTFEQFAGTALKPALIG